MNYYKNSRGCMIAARMRPGSAFANESMKLENSRAFIESITAPFVEIEFCEGREIYIAMFGSRNLLIPKKCKTLQDVAAWINTKDF